MPFKSSFLTPQLQARIQPGREGALMVAWACLILSAAGPYCSAIEDAYARRRSQPLYGSLCTYAAPPLLEDKRVDTQKLIAELVELRVNTYRWVSHQSEAGVEDLKKFLPLARAHNIRVWVTVNPPSERKPKDTRPLDERLAEYEKWAVDFAALSRTETNFVAWSIDDFVWNLKFFTPEAIKKIVMAARQINPSFAFLPCCYFKAATSRFVKDYGLLCDGVMFPYRDESGGANLQNPGHVEAEVKILRERFGPSCPIIVGVYSNPHSKLGPSKPEYVERVMAAAHRCADGVSVYRHPNPITAPERFEIVKRLYTAWSGATGQAKKADYRNRW
jgi:hypothetical protein